MYNYTDSALMSWCSQIASGRQVSDPLKVCTTVGQRACAIRVRNPFGKLFGGAIRIAFSTVNGSFYDPAHNLWGMSSFVNKWCPGWPFSFYLYSVLWNLWSGIIFWKRRKTRASSAAMTNIPSPNSDQRMNHFSLFLEFTSARDHL